MQTKLLREIKIALPNLRKSEVKVAEFILNKPSAIIELTTAQASSEIGVSEPTLIRFCKAVNFDGFQKFKLTLAQQLAADDYFNSYEIDPVRTTIQELTEKVFDSTISEILNVRSQLDQGCLEEAIETLANAKRVEFYAFGGSVPSSYGCPT
jgi:RpiR family carbohydrate utilization transcriptional regulator